MSFRRGDGRLRAFLGVSERSSFGTERSKRAESCALVALTYLCPVSEGICMNIYICIYIYIYIYIYIDYIDR